MNLKDSVQFEFGSVIGLLKREMESGPITNLYLNLIRSKQLARECKQTACEPSLLSIFGILYSYETSKLFNQISLVSKVFRLQNTKVTKTY